MNFEKINYIEVHQVLNAVGNQLFFDNIVAGIFCFEHKNNKKEDTFLQFALLYKVFKI